MRYLAPVLAVIATPLAALPPLGEVAEIREGLITAGIVIELDDKCDDVRLRTLRGLSFLNGLERRAEQLGYSGAEIDAYLDDDAEKDRLEGIARARLAEMGAVRGDAASHCAVAAREIAAGSVIGQLLR